MLYYVINLVIHPLSCFNEDFIIQILTSIISHNNNNVMNRNAYNKFIKFIK